MNSDELVKFDKIYRTFQQGDLVVNACVGISGTIRTNDKIAIIGPSGSGKTTLLNILAGLEKPTSGHISWPQFENNIDINPSKISIVYQNPKLINFLNIIENIKLPILINNNTEDKAMKKALYLLESFNLTNLANKLPEELSGGQLQRIAILIALSCDPPLILADEPTGQLDHDNANIVIDKLLAYTKHNKTALVITTHDLSIAEKMEKIWNIANGKLEVVK